VEQQVSLPLFLIKTETDIQATFTSHQNYSPKADLCLYNTAMVTHLNPRIQIRWVYFKSSDLPR
jgi:hypothetical protein